MEEEDPTCDTRHCDTRTKVTLKPLSLLTIVTLPGTIVDRNLFTGDPQCLHD